MDRYFLGIDNGTTSTVGIIKKSDTETSAYSFKMPTKKTQKQTIKGGTITRIDVKVLFDVLRKHIPKGAIVSCTMERPMVNPGRFNNTVSAVRALEAVTIVLESLKIPFEIVDSKSWQKKLLPKEAKGEQLKVESLKLGEQLYPNRTVKGHPDADGLLLAHFCMLKHQ